MILLKRPTLLLDLSPLETLGLDYQFFLKKFLLHLYALNFQLGILLGFRQLPLVLLPTELILQTVHRLILRYFEEVRRFTQM